MQNDELTVERLRGRIEGERRRAGDRRVRFSEELKRDSARFAIATGRGIERSAKGLGVSSTGLHHWVKRERQRHARRKPERGTLVEAEVTEDPIEPGALELIFPSGARATGLTLEQLRSLVVGR